MSAFKLNLKHPFLYVIPIMMFFIVNPFIIKGQDTIANNRNLYRIVTDTITKIDTTYVIDTIINRYTYVTTDTIYFNDEQFSESIEDEQPSPHKFEGNVGITLNQLAITHWAAGGESNGSGKITSNFTYRYDRKLGSPRWFFLLFQNKAGRTEPSAAPCVAWTQPPFPWPW